MDKTYLLDRHNNVHRQMAAFSELLHRLGDRYANDQLRQMLYAVCAGITVLPRRPMRSDRLKKNQTAVVANHDVTSLRQLHHLVDELKLGKRRRGIAKQDERHIVRYFEKFFDDIKNLATLKRYFEERIYACLYQYYYRPGVDDQISTARDSNGRPLATISDDGGDRQVWIIPEGTTVSDIVRQLWMLSRDWDMIIAGANHHVDDDFGYDSDPDAEPFEYILRLIPRWVETGFKALQLAKVWWTEANKVYNRSSGNDSPVDAIAVSTSPNAISRKIAITEAELSAINSKINHLEITIESAEEDLQQRMKDNGRLEFLRKKLEVAEEADTTARRTCDNLLNAKEWLEQQDEEGGNGVLEQLKRKLLVAYKTSEMTSYQVNLLREDVEFENSFVSPKDQYSLPPKMNEQQLNSLKSELAKDKERRSSCLERLERLKYFQRAHHHAVSQKTSTLSDGQVTKKTRRSSRRHRTTFGYWSDAVSDEYDDHDDATMFDRRAAPNLPSLTKFNDQNRSKMSSNQSLYRTHLPKLVKRL